MILEYCENERRTHKELLSLPIPASTLNYWLRSLVKSHHLTHDELGYKTMSYEIKLGDIKKSARKDLKTKIMNAHPFKFHYDFPNDHKIGLLVNDIGISEERKKEFRNNLFELISTFLLDPEVYSIFQKPFSCQIVIDVNLENQKVFNQAKDFVGTKIKVKNE